MKDPLSQEPLIKNKQPSALVGGQNQQDSRMRKTGRATAQDRPTMDQSKLDAARKAFSAQWNATILPQIETDEDWHYCWLSTTNQYDPIHQRQALGYEPVRPEEMPGFRATTMKSGEFAGCINQNEMVLFRIPREIYQVAMEEMHFHEPNRLEQSVKQMFDEAANLAGKSGRSLGRDVGDGVDTLGREHTTAPIFD